MDNPEHAAEVLMQTVREHHFMDARCAIEDSIEFLENLQSLISMELDGLNETKRAQGGE